MSSYLSFIIFLFFWNMSPGPNSALITRSAIKYGFIGGIAILSGFIICDSFYLSLAFFGVSEFIAKHKLLFYYTKLLGSIYILYIGITIILESLKENASESSEDASLNDFSFKENFLRGLFTDLSNPFTIVGMTSFILQFFRPEMLFSEKALYAAAVPLLSFFCYGLITVIFGNSYIRKFISPKMKWFDRIAGVILSYMAVTMMLF